MGFKIAIQHTELQKLLESPDRISDPELDGAVGGAERSVGHTQSSPESTITSPSSSGLCR